MALHETMRALADPTRREILFLLKGRSMSVGEICAHFSVSMPAISKHLAILKEADLIRDRREGKFVFYDLNTSVLDEALLWLDGLMGER